MDLVNFKPDKFGAYTLYLILSGVALGNIGIHNNLIINIILLMLSVLIFLLASNAYKNRLNETKLEKW